jgi:hypothetical protein
MKCLRLFSLANNTGAILRKTSDHPDDGLSTGVPGGRVAEK